MEQDVCKRMLEILEENAYVKLLGIEIEGISTGHCRGRMKVMENNINPYGALHGGSLYSLADIVAGTAACTYGNYVVTASGNMNFLLPAADIPYVYCQADVVRQGKRLAVYDVRISDEKGNILETATFSFYVTEEKVIS